MGREKNAVGYKKLKNSSLLILNGFKKVEFPLPALRARAELTAMNASKKHLISRRLVAIEILAFTSIILLIWSDEIFDFPHLFLGAEKTPVNWRESLFESAGVIIIGIIIIRLTHNMFQRMKYLEGILPICASCKKIRNDQGNWQQVESYIHERSEADFSHGICPECAEKLYPEINPYRKNG
ncbi:MAG: hypothetical protein SCH71_04575 [Desulfobulbaceae bacterium]|nr:hypothetical protein [Desulfobulbaceae bacterium]